MIQGFEVIFIELFIKQTLSRQNKFQLIFERRLLRIVNIGHLHFQESFYHDELVFVDLVIFHDV